MVEDSAIPRKEASRGPQPHGYIVAGVQSGKPINLGSRRYIRLRLVSYCSMGYN